MVKCKEIKWSKLWVLYHEKGDDFYLSSWQRKESPVPLLIVRLALATLSCGILIWSLVHHGASGPYWLIYLTNWGLLFMSGTMLSALLVSIMALTNTRDSSDSSMKQLPWYSSMYWLLINVNVTTSILITVLYWSLLFDSAAEHEGGAFALDISTHALNSGIALTELLTSRTPVNIIHIYQPVGVGLWYAAFSAIYYSAGGTNENGDPFIYDVLDWRDGLSAGSVVGISLVGALAIYFAVWTFGKIRDKLSNVFIQTTSQNLPLAPPLTPEPNRAGIV